MNMGKRISILFVSHDPRLYGAQKSLLDLVLGLDKNVFKPVVLDSREGPLTGLLAKNDIETIVCPFEWWVGGNPVDRAYRALKLCKDSQKILEKIKPLHPDLIYTNTSVIPIGGILALIMRKPHIWHVREFVQQDFGLSYDFGRYASMKFMSLSSERIICNSDAVRKNLSRHIPEKKLALVYNGILDASHPSAPPGKSILNKEAYTLCMVGSITPHKGHSDAIRAMHFLKDKGVKTKLLIVGEGPDDEIGRLRELSGHLGVSESVSFEGYRNDISSVFVNADITLICSKHEAFGRVAVESMAAGVPVIGTNTGGLPEIVEEGRTGLLYPPGDIPSLALKIQTLIDNPSVYDVFSREGHLRVYDKFTRQRYIADLERIILAAVGRER